MDSSILELQHLYILVLKFEQVQFTTRCALRMANSAYPDEMRHLNWIYTVCLSVQIHTVNTLSTNHKRIQ